MAVAIKVDINSDAYKIGQRIKNRRNKLGISKEELANKPGMESIDRTAISRYENGTKGEMSVATLKKFAIALETTPDELMGFEKELPIESEIADIMSHLGEDDQAMLLKMAKALLLQQQLSA